MTTAPDQCTSDEKKITRCMRGDCFVVIINGQRQVACKCYSGYTGKRCDEKIPEISSNGVRRREVPAAFNGVNEGLTFGASTSPNSSTLSAIYTAGLVLGTLVMAVLVVLVVVAIWKKLSHATSMYKRLNSEENDDVFSNQETGLKNHPVKLLKQVKQRTASASRGIFLFQELTPEDAVFDLDEFGGLEIIPNAGSSVQ